MSAPGSTAVEGPTAAEVVLDDTVPRIEALTKAQPARNHIVRVLVADIALYESWDYLPTKRGLRIAPDFGSASATEYRPTKAYIIGQSPVNKALA